MNTNATPSDCPTGACGHNNYMNTFMQSANKQATPQQPMPMQTLPLFLQQPAVQQAPMVQMPQYPTSFNQSPQMVSTTSPQFRDYEQLAMLNQGLPITAESLQYLNGFMRTQIGRRVKVEFLIGTNSFVDKEGTLLAVGVNYIIINETETDDITACDFYNIKFIRFYY